MKRVVCLIVLLSALPLAAQVRLRFIGPPAPVVAVDNPISATRQPLGSTAVPNAGWSQAGYVGSIPDRSGTVCATIAPYTGTPAAINNAIAACASGGTVLLSPAGTYTINDTLRHHKDGVTLRGLGASQTKVVITGHSNHCAIGPDAGIDFCGGGQGSFNGAAIGGSDMSVQNATWDASAFTQGTTSITLNTVSGLTAGAVGTGSLIFISQQNDASDGYPAAGDLYVCEVAGSNCSNQGANNWGEGGYSQVEAKTVTAISGAGPFTVTISPGLESPNFRAGRGHHAYWNNTILQNAGIEDIFFDLTSCSCPAIHIKDVSDSWVLGSAFVVTEGMTYTGGGINIIFVLYSSHVLFRSNYMYGPRDSNFDRYSLNDSIVGNNLYENNIYQAFIGSLTPNDPGTGNVYAYNFAKNDELDPTPGSGFLSPCGTQLHSGTTFMTLHEGNDWQTYMGDVIHGVHFFGTAYRNLFTSNECVGTTTNQAVMLNTNNRFFNFVGNVMADPGQWTTYQLLASSPGDNVLWSLDWKGSGSGSAINDDSNVSRTLLRWMNWDSVTSAADSGPNELTGIRKCVGNGNPVAACTASEVPSGITNYANPVPGATIPNSLYLSAQPGWWPASIGGVSTPYPAVGPDVTGGTIANSGGHAYKNPARVCFDTRSTKTGYASVTPPVKDFDRVSCYGATK